MRVFVRVNGHPFGELNLVPGQIYTVGRAPDRRIHLPFAHISRHLCQLVEREPGRWWVEPDKPNGWAARPLEGVDIISLPGAVEIISEGALNNEITQVGALPLQSQVLSPDPTGRGQVEPTHWARSRSFAVREHLPYLLSGALAATFVVFGLVVALWYQSQLKALDPMELADFAKQRILTIEHQADEAWLSRTAEALSLEAQHITDSRGSCTGFMVGPDVMVTAYHCLFGVTGLEAIERYSVRNHKGQLVQIKRVLGLNIGRDTLILETEPMSGEALFFEPAPSWAPGQRAYTVGNAEGEGVILRDGLLTGETASEFLHDVKYLRFSAAASPGNSGGPLIDDHGRLLGLVVMRSESENYNKAVRVADVVADLKQFADTRETKSVSFDIRRWPVWVDESRSMKLFSVFQMPVPDREAAQSAKLLDHLDIPIEVPVSLSGLGDQVFTELNRRLKERRTGLLAQKPLAEWYDLVSTKNPVFSPFGGRQSLNEILVTDTESGPSIVWAQPDSLGLEKATALAAMGVDASLALSHLEPVSSEALAKASSVGVRVYSNQRHWSSFRKADEIGERREFLSSGGLRFLIEWPSEPEQNEQIEAKLGVIYRSLLRDRDGQYPVTVAEVIPFVRESAPKQVSLRDDHLEITKFMNWKEDQRETVLLQAVRFDRLASYVFCVTEGLATYCSEDLVGDVREMPASKEITSQNFFEGSVRSRLIGGRIKQNVSVGSQPSEGLRLDGLESTIHWPATMKVIATQKLKVLVKPVGESSPQWVTGGYNLLVQSGSGEGEYQRCSIAVQFGKETWYPSAQPHESAPVSREPATTTLTVDWSGQSSALGHKLGFSGECSRYTGPGEKASAGVWQVDSGTRKPLTFSHRPSSDSQ